MAFSQPLHGHSDAARLRKDAGAYLKDLREQRKLTQQEVANRVGLTYYTMVSQIESGKTRLPPDKVVLWAEALGVNKRTFAKRLLSYYDPFTWEAIFGQALKHSNEKLEALDLKAEADP